MCDMDYGGDDGFDLAESTDETQDSFETENGSSEFESFEDIGIMSEGDEADAGIASGEELLPEFDDTEGEYLSLSDIESEFPIDEFQEEEDHGEEIIDFTPEAELTYTEEEIQDLKEENSEDSEFLTGLDHLIESGRVDVVEEIPDDESEGEKVLTREITPEIIESRERDTEEVLENYRDNLRDRDVSEEAIESFVEQERGKIYAEYEALDKGNTSENIYYVPTEWDSIADSLSEELVDESELTEDGLGTISSEFIDESAEIEEVSTQETEETQEQLTLSDLPDIPEEIDEVTSEEIDATSDEKIEDIILEEASDENTQEMNLLDVSEEIVEETSDETGEEIDTVLDEVLDDEVLEANMEEADESCLSGFAEEIYEDNPELDDTSLDSVSEESTDTNSLINEGVDTEVDDEAETGEYQKPFEDVNPSDLEETSNFNEFDINYDEIYQEIDPSTLEKGFENIDIYEDAERLDSSLENFEQDRWEEMDIDGQKAAIYDLSEYVKEAIGFVDPPAIEYYYNPQEGDYGGYDRSRNALRINEFMLYDSEEASDTVAHELWHAHQYECADNPQTERDYQYRFNLQNYIRPEMGHESYENQLVEAEARAFAEQFKGRLSSLGERTR